MEVSVSDCKYLYGLVTSVGGNAIPFGTPELHVAHPYGIASLYARTLDGSPIIGDADKGRVSVNALSLCEGLSTDCKTVEVLDDCSAHVVDGKTYSHQCINGVYKVEHPPHPFHVFRVPSSAFKSLRYLKDEIFVHLRVKSTRVSFYAGGVDVNFCQSNIPKDYDVCINGSILYESVIKHAEGEVEVSITQDG